MNVRLVARGSARIVWGAVFAAVLAVGFVAVIAGTLLACGGSEAGEARRRIREKHAPRVAEIVIEDLVRHRRGIVRAADRIAAGFVKVSGEQQEKDMRTVLALLRNAKKGIPELIISPMSFMAVVGMDGRVIARNAEPDRMKGMDLATQFPVVKRALAGETGYALGEFKSLEKDGKPSVTILMAAPAHYRGAVVGALVLGIPLWRFQQRLSKQLQAEAAGPESGIVLWAYLYRGAELHKHGTPPDLDLLVPDDETRRAGYAKSPGGFTGEVAQHGFWYGWGVRPLRVLGDDVGMIVFRMDPR
jgi:hypothetical protein